jgi:nucleoside triphosphate pyrophosphatase
VISPQTPLILGSTSPRRRAILSDLGLPLRVFGADVPESVRTGESPAAFLERVVLDKLGAVAAKLVDESFAGVLVADTIVVVDGAILGKPVDTRDAERLLASIVGRTHVVHTRYALSRAEAAATPALARTVETRVTMRAASDVEIRAYAAMGEGLDKAGAYAAQGVGAFLIERIEGSYTNVIGLPACEVIVDLERTGLLGRFP